MNDGVEPNRRWWQYIGPWPLRPLLLTLVMFMVYLTFRAGVLGGAFLLNSSFFSETVIPGIGISLVLYAISYLGMRWQRRVGVNWLNYLLPLALVAVIGVAFRRYTLPDIGEGLPAENVALVIRVLGIMMLASAVAGAVVSRLERQVAATQEALAVAREQQVQLITAEEEVRAQIALLLYDGVQAGLLSTSVELRAIAKQLSGPQADEIRALVERLESIRSIDVRRAARVLSPSLKDVDLETALEDLAAQYETVFTTTITIDTRTEHVLREQYPMTALALYRVVDQGLLNVAVHANATEVRIDVREVSGGFECLVQDNGVGVPEEPRRGLGTTIITTWVRATAGEWSLRRAASGKGSELRAFFTPVRSSPTAVGRQWW